MSVNTMYNPPHQEETPYDPPKQESYTDKATLLSDRSAGGRRSISATRESFLNNPRNLTGKPPRHERVIYITRLCLRLLSFLMSIVILGLLGHTLWKYHQTKNWRTINKKTRLSSRVWPVSFTVHPNYIMLGVAATAAILSFFVALASLSKAVRRLTNLSNIVTLIVSGIALALWIMATVYFKKWDTGKKFKYDLWSWVCSHKNDHYSNIDYAPLCTEMRLAFWGAVAVTVLEGLAIFTVVWGIVQMRKRKYERIGGGM